MRQGKIAWRKMEFYGGHSDTRSAFQDDVAHPWPEHQAGDRPASSPSRQGIQISFERKEIARLA